MNKEDLVRKLEERGFWYDTDHQAWRKHFFDLEPNDDGDDPDLYGTGSPLTDDEVVLTTSTINSGLQPDVLWDMVIERLENPYGSVEQQV
jgi:hypothetical protein